MDEWQKHLYEKCAELVVKQGMSKTSTSISICEKEAYVIMKALEDQQRYTHPMLEIPSEAICDK